MNSLRRRLRAEYPVAVYQWVTIWLVLTVMWTGGIYGAWVYVRDQDRDLARSQREQCVLRVESREALRGAFTDVYDLIDETNPESRFTAAARARLDETYPPLALADCPKGPS